MEPALAARRRGPGDGGERPGRSADSSPPSSDLQDFCTDLAASSASFVPTVTAISTSPDLQWLVQPTLISSVAPSQSRGHPYGVSAPAPTTYSRPAVLKTPGGRGQSIGRRGKVEQVSAGRSCWGDWGDAPPAGCPCRGHWAGSGTERPLSAHSCPRRRRKREGFAGNGTRWQQPSAATGGGSSPTRCRR